MNKDRIILKVLDTLEARTGIRAKWIFPKETDKKELDGQITIQTHGGELTLYIEAKTELRGYQIDQLNTLKNYYGGDRFIVIADRIYPNIKDRLREEQINYLDGAGNIYLKHSEQFIWLDGKKEENPVKPTTNRAFTKAGLRVVFHLLNHRDAINLTYRELAEKTGVALGNITYIIDGLKELGFILKVNEGTKILINKRDLFERWIEGYGTILKPSLLLGRFNLADNKNWQNYIYDEKNDQHYILGGEPAAAELTNGYLVPNLITVYTDLNIVEMTINWRIMKDRNGNLLVYEKFWKEDFANEMLVAPTMLVYADLLLTNDPRCLETAKLIFNEYLANEFTENI